MVIHNRDSAITANNIVKIVINTINAAISLDNLFNNITFIIYNILLKLDIVRDPLNVFFQLSNISSNNNLLSINFVVFSNIMPKS